MKKNLDRMTPEELGQLFPVAIVDYNQDWPKLYLKEKQKIINTVSPENISRMEHIGSTSVPGLSAKPTIDIFLEIPDITNCDDLIQTLQKIDYHYIPKPENPPPHMMFAKGYSEKGLTGQTFHIHVRYPGDWDEIVFRDYLINNPDTAHDYVNLKQRLSVEFKNDREKYTDGKTDFIKKVTQRARKKEIQSDSSCRK
jgi:GrpB-like predicted nucleotidyltransferase (UPF0157 family)